MDLAVNSLCVGMRYAYKHPAGLFTHCLYSPSLFHSSLSSLLLLLLSPFSSLHSVLSLYLCSLALFSRSSILFHSPAFTLRKRDSKRDLKSQQQESGIGKEAHRGSVCSSPLGERKPEPTSRVMVSSCFTRTYPRTVRRAGLLQAQQLSAWGSAAIGCRLISCSLVNQSQGSRGPRRADRCGV